MDYSKLADMHLDVTVDNKVALATINLPEKRNALGDGLHDALEEFLHMVNYDHDVNAIVLTGNPEGRAFCSGGDVASMNAVNSGENVRDPGYMLRGARYLIQRFLNCEVPLIAAINGHAVGLGCTVALMCDVTFLSDAARLGDNHTRVGIVAGDGGAVIWPHLIGPHRAKELLMSGKLMTADECEKIGIVNHVVPHDKVLDEAMTYARDLAGGARWAIRWTKMAVNKLLINAMNANLDFSLAVEAMSMQTQDHKEATSAFVEKRDPKFTGH